MRLHTLVVEYIREGRIRQIDMRKRVLLIFE